MRSSTVGSFLSFISMALMTVGCGSYDGDAFSDFDINDESAIATSSDALGTSGTYTTVASLPLVSVCSTCSLQVQEGGLLRALPDGRAIYVSGYGGGSMVDKVVRFYNPASNAWSEGTQAPVIPESGALKEQLNDGRIIIVDSTRTQTYNVSTNSWSTSSGFGSPAGRRHVKLVNGQIVAAGGGSTTNFWESASTYTVLFDPVSNKWSFAGSMRNGRFGHGITQLQNGKVLVAGGTDANMFDTSNRPEQKAELWDPATKTWSSTGNLNVAHSSANLVTLPNGKALLTGGSTWEVYDPATGTWSVFTPPASVANAAAFKLNTGKFLFQAGATSWIFDPATFTFVQTGSPHAPRISAAAELNNGGVLLVAGVQAVTTGCDKSCVEVYTP